jgi:hypothetical protein
MLIKGARKTSSDPMQEKLRQAKATWNAAVSQFINDVINYKKLMNGHPNKFNKVPSKIIFPIPGDPASIVNSLASKFQDLAQEAVVIVQQQAQYSQTRRQKRTDQATQTLNKLDEKYGPTGPEVASPIAATPAPTGSELTKQLGAAWEHKYELVSEGSNPFSRLLTKMRTPRVGVGAGAQKRRMRMDLLRAALKSYRALGKFQVQISKSSKDSVVSAYKDMQQAWNEWSTVSRYFNQYVNSIPDQALRPEDMKDELPPGTESDLPLSNKVPVKNDTVPPPPKETQEQPPVKKPSEIVVPVIPPDLKDKKMKEEVVSASDQLEVVAQAFLQKWLGKKRHQSLPGKSSGLRLQIFEIATKVRKDINSVMDLLEQGLAVEALGSKISEVSGQMNTIRSLMRSLHNTEKPMKGQPTLEGFF